MMGRNEIQKYLDQYSQLADLLLEITDEQRAFFHRLYGPDMYKIKMSRLKRAIEQCEATIKINQKKKESDPVCKISDTATTVMDKLLQKTETFTAYDVTEEVRSHMKDTNIFHYKLKPFIHEYLEDVVNDGLYTADLENMPNNGPMAIVYKPVGKVNKTPTPVSTPTPTDNKIVLTCKTTPPNARPKRAIPSQTKTDIIQPDKRGRVCIGKEHVERLGLKPFDKVTVYQMGDVIVITRLTLNANVLGEYTVDKYSNIRVGTSVLGVIDKAFKSVGVYSGNYIKVIKVG